jgi:hypothetical protein
MILWSSGIDFGSETNLFHLYQVKELKVILIPEIMTDNNHSDIDLQMQMELLLQWP